MLIRRRQWHLTLVLLPGKSRGWRSLVGCSLRGPEESDTTGRLHFHFSLSCIGEGNGNPLQCSCLENPRDRGAWWASVYGVAQSRTWLKQLSSGSSRMLIGLKAGEGDDRGWDGWMSSPTRWTWVWVSSGSWWWTGRPGMLQSTGLQRVGHDWATGLRVSLMCSSVVDTSKVTVIDCDNKQTLHQCMRVLIVLQPLTLGCFF